MGSTKYTIVIHWAVAPDGDFTSLFRDATDLLVTDKMLTFYSKCGSFNRVNLEHTQLVSTKEQA